MTGRAERIGLNEAVFREVNERIEDLAETFDLTREPLDLVCECGDAQCVQRITMTRAEYEALRSDPRQFAVYPGHEYPEVETVLRERKGYHVVSKNQGAPERIAERTDPRS
jgi:hypothetical protein